MDPAGRPQSWRELWQTSTPVKRRRLIWLLGTTLLTAVIALAVCAVAVWLVLR